MPAGVSLRHSKGELTMQDIPALMTAGMPWTCNQIQQQAMNAAVARMTAEMEEKRAQRELNQHNINAETKRIQQMSRWGFTGKV